MKQIDSIKLLQKITIAANEATDVEEALQICLDEICELIKWPVGHVYLHSDDNLDEMVSSKIWHLDDPEKFTSFKKVTDITSFQAGEGLPGRVYASGEPDWILDVTQDRNFPRAELAKNIEVKSGFAFPIIVDSKVAAILEFYSPKAVSPDKDLLDITTQVSTQLSHVIKRKRAENEMRQNAEIINQIQDTVITTDLDGVIRSWNRGAEVQLGYTAEEMIGKSIELIYLQPESKVMHSATIDNLIENGRIGFESEMRKKSGTIFPVYLSQSLSKDAMGTITGIINYSSDITQQKQADAILERAKVIDQIHDAVISTDLEGYISLWNKGAERLFGYSTEEILGKPIGQLYPGEKQSITPKEFIKLIKSQGSFDLESKMIKKSGEIIYVHNALSALTDEEDNIRGIISYAMDISGRKQAEAELNNSKQMLQSVLDTIPIRVFWKDSDLRYLGCNQKFVNDTGLDSIDDIIGKDDYDLNWGEEEATKYRQDDMKVMESGIQKLSYEEHQVWPDGSEIWVSTSKIPLVNIEGDSVGVLGCYEEITQRKKAEVELQQAHQRLTYHTEYSPLAVIEFDKDFRVKRWTKAAEKVFGWKAEELIGKHLYEWKFVYEGDKGSVDNVLNNLSQANELSYINFNRNYTKDGKVIDCEWYNSVLVDDAGNIDSVLSLAHDITERKQAEKELRLLHQRLDLHMENSPLGLLEMDKDFRVLRWSKQAEKIFGWKEDEIINKPLRDIGLVYGEDANDVDKKLNDLAEGKIQNLINFNRNYTKDGGVIDVEWYNSAVIDENGELVSLLSLAHDITDLKHAEEQLEKYSKHLEELVIGRTSELELAQKELVKKERLAVLGQLTATVSHELRNPLAAISLSLESIKIKVVEQDFNVENILKRVERNIERCINIIEQMLAYVPTSRRDTYNTILTNIDQWIIDILDEYEFPEGIKIKRIINAGVNIKCEKENIRRCIINVITNACQAMINDDSNEKNKDNQLIVKTKTSDGKFIIEISDTGVGIPKDNIDQIFEPLFSTKVYGVGLGLPIIKQIIEQHHGGVTINSVENEGTQVNLWLPLNADQVEAEHR